MLEGAGTIAAEAGAENSGEVALRRSLAFRHLSPGAATSPSGWLSAAVSLLTCLHQLKVQTHQATRSDCAWQVRHQPKVKTVPQKTSCDVDELCRYYGPNPIYGELNFDHMLGAAITIFQCIWARPAEFIM